MTDRVAAFFAERTPRRALAVGAFLLVLFTFRHLGLLLVFFVSFERALAFSAGALSRRFKVGRLPALLGVLLVTAAALGLAGWLSAGRLAQAVVDARQSLPERITQLRGHPWFQLLQQHLPDTDELAKSAEHYAADLAKSAAALGRALLQAVIGLVLAIVYFLDEERLRAFRASLAPRSLVGTLARWLEHVTEAVSLMVQLQLIVAGCNALLTLPVLLLIGVPRAGALMVLIFVSGLIPVVGNLISGAVLVVLAYEVKGWLGVALFVVLTFVLHKVESYYLNPRLTARHVALPGFVLILSLIACEHLFGFVGLFLSFPLLYVAGKLLTEFREEDAPPPAAPPPEPATPATAS